jgi:predicted TIM-barrel fold metal-dependent hydrolase
VACFRWWYNGPGKWRYRSLAKRCQKLWYKASMYISRSKFFNFLYWLIGIWLFIQILFYTLDHVTNLLSGNKTYQMVRDFLITNYIYVLTVSFAYTLLFFFILFAFFPSLRNLLFFMLKKLIRFLGMLPGKETKKLASRYLNIGRHAFYRNQEGIFGNLRDQYPMGTSFVVLPMDMEFMQAGKVGEDYLTQLNKLAEIKASKTNGPLIHPFIFVDPRRIARDKSFFNYSINNGELLVDPGCRVRQLIEEEGFAGFKIYPALGYYPFDKDLLALWKYAQQKKLPIMTHCIRGTIFFRGEKDPAWDEHPVFEQATERDHYEPLLLPQTRNIDFCNNFTHPLNYLCLLDEELLIKVLSKCRNSEIQSLFGYTENCTALKSNLSELKICLAHFGGEDEWLRYFELDRDNYSTQVIKYPDHGIDFRTSKDLEERRGKLEQLWKYCDWYSIICSLMLQYDNVYADISYISHDNAIHALLKRTLREENKKLRQRVLFGTDFYVVRNHKSEKQIMADTFGGLSSEEFDIIARDNPKSYLARLP